MHTSDILSDEEVDLSLRKLIEDYRNLKCARIANELPQRLELPPAEIEDEEAESDNTDSLDE